MRTSLLPALIGSLLGFAATVNAGTIPGDLALTPAVTGVGQPIAIRNAGDGSGRLFVVRRDGFIYVVADGASTPAATPFLNIDALVAINGEGGLLGLAFDPDYENNRRFYVSYTDNNVDTVIARYTASVGNPNVADPASATILLRVDQGSHYHKGGDLHFGLDGYLYISLGDGAEGSGVDDCNRAQSLTPQDVSNNNSDADCTPDGGFAGNANARALMGKILRIDPSGTTPAGANELCASAGDGSAPYAIPAANPFAGSNGGAGRCDEIFAYGLRNPFRFSVDRSTGDLFIGDVGEGAMEEVDFIPAASPGGINFGWPQCEGTLGTCGASTAPIFVDDRRNNNNCSITGGFRYRGAITGLQGTYVFSDYCSGSIRFAEQSGGGSWTYSQWLNGPDMQHTSFGEDEDGELYLAEVNSDRVMRFTSAQVGPVVDIFQNGFEN
jgi:glucose/arabinose dehydrogenase